MWYEEKQKVFDKLHSCGTLNSAFNFLKSWFWYMWCIWKKRSMIYMKIQINDIWTWYCHYKWSSTQMKFKNKDLHDLFIQTLLWINLYPAKNEFKVQIFGSPELNMSFLQDCFGIQVLRRGVSKYAKLSAKGNLKYVIMASLFNVILWLSKTNRSHLGMMVSLTIFCLIGITSHEMHTSSFNSS